jgi:hypothetical protein
MQTAAAWALPACVQLQLGVRCAATQCANISTVNEDRPTELGLRLHSALRHLHARARNLVYARVGV